MKLSDYMPEIPALAAQMTELNSQINLLSMMKASSTSETPSIGLDGIVNNHLKQQMHYREQLATELTQIAMNVEEIRAPISHITSEVFRRGFEFSALHDYADKEQLTTFQSYMKKCNSFNQSLEEVLRQFHTDVNILDDGFLFLSKEYACGDDGVITSQIKEIRRLNPALVEFDLNNYGHPQCSHYICVIHREAVYEEEGVCEESGCALALKPAMYYFKRKSGELLYLLESEIIHMSKFNPTETYGFSPILTIFEKALTLIGMDKNLYRYFYERKAPASMLMVNTSDPEALRRERENIAAQVKADPNFIPMVAVNTQDGRGRVELVRLFHTLQEMDYMPVKAEIRERIAAMWGVSPAWQGAPDAFGGLSSQTQQLVVMSRVVEADQSLFHSKVFPILLEQFNITDWSLHLRVPEEKTEATKLSFAQQRVAMASQLKGMGFAVTIANSTDLLGVPLEDAQFIVANTEDEQTPELKDGPKEVTEFVNELPERDIDEWAAAREEKGENRQFGYRGVPGRPLKGSEKTQNASY